jgi:hypothetical protein
LAISNKGQFKKNERKEFLKYFQGVAGNLENNYYSLKKYCGICFPGNLATLGRLFDPKQSPFYESYWIFFYFFIVFCRRVAETRPNSF